MRIELEKVSKSFFGSLALNGVSAKLEPGEVVSLLGANGAGKTTLLGALAGIVAPEGQILFDGERFHRGRMDLRRRLMFLPDQPLLFGRMSPLEHLAMCVHLYEAGEPKPERVVEVLQNLNLLGLAASAVGTFSRGQAYKASLAALMVLDPELWILDEPFASGMDPGGIRYFRQEASAAAKRGRTVLYSTQILDLAERFSDRLWVLDEGRLRMEGSAEELKATAGSPSLEGVFLRLRDPESGA
jgi:ABC-type multidrug transport system ATPase subunit